jgi:hypothetical protein
MNPLKYNRARAVLQALRSDNDLNPERQRVLKSELMQDISHYEASLSHVHTSFWQRFFVARPLPIALTLVVAILIAGGGAFATASSLPGEVLHPIKLAAEKLELTLTASVETRAQVQAKHTSERLHELAELETKAETTRNDREKTEIEREHVSAATAVQSELETTFNTLNEVQTQFESDGNVKAVAHMKDVRERLTHRAANSRFKVKIEEEHGAVKIRVENEDRKNEKEEEKKKEEEEKESELKNLPPKIQLRTEIQPKLKLRIDQKPEDTREPQDRLQGNSAN